MRLSPNVRNRVLIENTINQIIRKYFWSTDIEYFLKIIKEEIEELMIENEYYEVNNIQYNYDKKKFEYDLCKSNKIRLQRLEDL